MGLVRSARSVGRALAAWPPLWGVFGHLPGPPWPGRPRPPGLRRPSLRAPRDSFPVGLAWPLGPHRPGLSSSRQPQALPHSRHTHTGGWGQEDFIWKWGQQAWAALERTVSPQVQWGGRDGGGAGRDTAGDPALVSQPREERVCGPVSQEVKQASRGGAWAPGVQGPEGLQTPSSLCRTPERGGGRSGPQGRLDDAVLGQLVQLQVIEGLPRADDRDVCRGGAGMSRRSCGPTAPLGPCSLHPKW